MVFCANVPWRQLSVIVMPTLTHRLYRCTILTKTNVFSLKMQFTPRSLLVESWSSLKASRKLCSVQIVPPSLLRIFIKFERLLQTCDAFADDFNGQSLQIMLDKKCTMKTFVMPIDQKTAHTFLKMCFGVTVEDGFTSITYHAKNENLQV